MIKKILLYTMLIICGSFLYYQILFKFKCFNFDKSLIDIALGVIFSYIISKLSLKHFHIIFLLLISSVVVFFLNSLLFYLLCDEASKSVYSKLSLSFGYLLSIYTFWALLYVFIGYLVFIFLVFLKKVLIDNIKLP